MWPLGSESSGPIPGSILGFGVRPQKMNHIYTRVVCIYTRVVCIERILYVPPHEIPGNSSHAEGGGLILYVSSILLMPTVKIFGDFYHDVSFFDIFFISHGW